MYNAKLRRGMAQLGRALGLGPRGRKFESCRPDQSFFRLAQYCPPRSEVFAILQTNDLLIKLYSRKFLEVRLNYGSFNEAFNTN